MATGAPFERIVGQLATRARSPSADVRDTAKDQSGPGATRSSSTDGTTSSQASPPRPWPCASYVSCASCVSCVWLIPQLKSVTRLSAMMTIPPSNTHRPMDLRMKRRWSPVNPSRSMVTPTSRVIAAPAERLTASPQHRHHRSTVITAAPSSQQHRAHENRGGDGDDEHQRTEATANRRPNVPACNATSLMSTIGPTTRNARRAVRENRESPATTKPSASERTASTTADRASAITEIGPRPAT
jgi:hypothetical protein